MDTSKEYVLMCEKAEEIQAIRQADKPVEWWKQGDFIYDNGDEYIFTVCGIRHCACDTGYFNTDNIVWLPRQDQLQKIVKKIKPSDWYNTEYTVWDGVLDNWEEFNTGEQLWLAFVMREKYGKVWEKGDWVKRKC